MSAMTNGHKRKTVSGRSGHSRLDPSERREQIIETATTLISHYGFWGFSVRQVAAELGLTEPSVIYHFKNKVGLLLAVLDHRDQQDVFHNAALLGVPSDGFWNEPSFGLREYCNVVVARNAEQPEIVRLYTILQGEAISPSHPAFEYFQKRERRSIMHMSMLARNDALADPYREATLVLSTMDGMQIRWLRNPDGFDMVAEWAAFAEARWGSQ